MVPTRQSVVAQDRQPTPLSTPIHQSCQCFTPQLATPLSTGVCTGCIVPHHPARADIDDGRWRGTGRSGTTFTSRGICGDMVPALPRLAERARLRSFGQSGEGPNRWTDCPSRKPALCEASRPTSGKATGACLLRLRWFMRPHIQMKSRGRVPRRLRPRLSGASSTQNRRLSRWTRTSWKHWST